MPKPVLSDADFPKLHREPKRTSCGTVDGKDVDAGTVRIERKNKKIVWEGKVTTQIKGVRWNATVTCTTDTDPDHNRNTEKVSLTVTNGSGTSDPPIEPNSEVVPVP